MARHRRGAAEDSVAAESSKRGRGNAVGLTSIFNRRQFSGYCRARALCRRGSRVNGEQNEEDKSSSDKNGAESDGKNAMENGRCKYPVMSHLALV